MAAASTATKSASGTITSFFSVVNKGEHPDLFFGRVRTCLEANQLPKALEILRLGNSSIHRNLVPSNIETVAAFLSVEKETPEKTVNIRCARLTKIMQQHFPDVFQLELIKKKGLEAGLTAEEVEERLEQVVLNDGSFWIIKSTHNANFDAWEQALLRMASSNAINFWNEGSEASKEQMEVILKTKNPLASQGLFHGLENSYSMHWKCLIPFYFALFEKSNLARAIKFPSQVVDVKFDLSSSLSITHFLLHCSQDKESNKASKKGFFLETLAKTAERSNLAHAILQKARVLSKKKDHSGKDIMNAGFSLVAEEPDLIKWVTFLEQHLPNVFADCTQEVQIALKEAIGAGKKYREAIAKKAVASEDGAIPLTDFFTINEIERDHGQALKEAGFEEAQDKFISAFRPVRDEIFAATFGSGWPKRNKDVLSVVMFGKNHARGFKQHVFACQKLNHTVETKDENVRNPIESKADSKLSK